MPIYEFRCEKCKNQFETIVPSAAGVEEVSCPKCGGKEVRKEISTFSSRFAASAGPSTGGGLSGCSSKSGFS